MTINPTCYRCDKELQEPGAILLSHPIERMMAVYKYHICRKCEKIIMNMIDKKHWPKSRKQ